MANLPTGYTELEYIESTGTQYLDTGIVPDSNTIFEAEVQIISLSTNSFVLGARRAFGNGAFDILAMTNGQVRFDYSSSSATKSVSMFERRKIKLSGSGCFFGSASHDFGGASLSCPVSIYLFGGNNNGSLSSPIKMRLHSVSIYDESSLVFQGVPCKSQSGEIGLYDLVSNGFFRNSGTGAFVAGPVLIVPPETPSGLKNPLSASLVWGRVDSAEYYNVYRDGHMIGSTKEPFFVDLSVSDGITYVYSVKAANAAGESGISNEATVTVKAGYSTLVPLISSAFFQ